MDLKEKATQCLKSPFMCGAVIALATYIIYSFNYITKDNARQKFPKNKQRMSNAKSCLLVFLFAVLVLVFYKYISSSPNNLQEPVEEYIRGGYAPF